MSITEVVEAAKRACYDFIALPQGYETMIEKLVTFCLEAKAEDFTIRAILKDAPIVIMDEATSLEDPEK